MTKPNDPASALALPEDTILVPTEGMTPEELGALAAEMAAALLGPLNEWREANGLPPLCP